jgi:hypothetical protein
MYKTILGFDTSARNALHRGGPNFAPRLAGLDTGYAIRLNGTALDEIVAHSLPQERERLRKLWRRLLANGAGDVLLPFHEITTRLAVAFESGRPFDWTRVDVRSNEYMRFIFDDEVSALFEEAPGSSRLENTLCNYYRRSGFGGELISSVKISSFCALAIAWSSRISNWANGSRSRRLSMAKALCSSVAMAMQPIGYFSPSVISP